MSKSRRLGFLEYQETVGSFADTSLGSAPLASFRSPASVSGDDECSK
jgi:hypothetical protein